MTTIFLSATKERKKPSGTFVCKACQREVPRSAFRQFYCRPCSDAKHVQRARTKVATEKAHSLHIARGSAISKRSARQSICTRDEFQADDGWMVRFRIPFSQAASKNHVYSLGGVHGHVYKRQESRRLQDLVARKTKEACRSLPVCNNKVWIDLFVQKPNHRSDAINVIDVICDGLKVGLGVDDRWFCIRQLDWEIAKVNPQIHISLYQRDAWNALACSHCGRVLRLECFRVKKTTKTGRDRICKECLTGKQIFGQKEEGVTVLVDRAVTEQWP